MGCAQARLRTKVDVRDLESTARTGDIILFSSKHAAANITKCFTASTWDHIGIVVRFGPGQVFILEYAGGVYLYPLFTRLYTYYAVQGRAIMLRRLLPGQDRMDLQYRVEAFVRNVLGHKPPSIEEMVLAVLRQERFVSSFIARLAGGGDSNRSGRTPVAVKDDLETLFCSKLIAAIYKDVGILASHRVSADFLPKHFSADFDGFLDLQAGAMLGPELPINFESVSDEIRALQEQIAEDSKWRPEEAVRAVSNFYLDASSSLHQGFTKGWGGLGESLSERLATLERGLHGWSAAADAAIQRAEKAPLSPPKARVAGAAAAGTRASDVATTTDAAAEGDAETSRGVGGVELSSPEVIRLTHGDHHHDHHARGAAAAALYPTGGRPDEPLLSAATSDLV